MTRLCYGSVCPSLTCSSLQMACWVAGLAQEGDVVKAINGAALDTSVSVAELLKASRAMATPEGEEGRVLFEVQLFREAELPSPPRGLQTSPAAFT